MAINDSCVEEHEETEGFQMVCHHCSEKLDLSEFEPLEESQCPNCGAAFVVPHRFGDYMLQDVIQQDEVITTYAATDLKLQRDVFVKVVDRDYINLNADFSKGLNLPLNSGLVTVYSSEFVEEGLVLVTEAINGNTIQKYLDDGDHLTVENVEAIAQKVCESLAFASANGVIHGNLTPSSIWINARGEFKVSDFSLRINLCNDKSSPEKISKALDVRYASPSKLQHLVHDEKSDLYSLGTIMYQLLTRVLPFSAPYYHEAIQERQTKSVQNPRILNKNIPEELADVIVSLLVQDGTYNSFSDVLNYFESAKKKSAPSAKKSSGGLKSKKQAKKKKVLQPQQGQAPIKKPSVKASRKLEKLQKSVLFTRLVAIIAIGFALILFTSRYFPGSGVGKASEQFLSLTLDKVIGRDKPVTPEKK